MKNKREIILDFTSLLDIIMLILFFFVIFAQLDTNEAISKAEEMQAQAEQEKINALDEWEAANEALEKAEAELEELQQANALAESVIINGASDFEKALRLKVVLDGERDSWSISVKCAEQKDNETIYTEVGVISDVRNRGAEDIAKDFEKIVTGQGYSKDDAFICDLMYDPDGTGSRIAKDNTDEMLRFVQNNLGYKYLFTSTTDLSWIEGDKDVET